MSSRRVSVVGAGVLGLSCAVRLAEAGHEVDVLARDLPLETTSAVAGGHWGPFLAEPAGLVERWSRRSFEVFQELSAQPGTGVAMRSGFYAGSYLPSWAASMADLMPLEPVGADVVRNGGWRTVTPMANMPVYLEYLVRRLKAAGGTLTRMSLAALPTRGLVVNCTGLAARSLARDPALRPVGGQVVVVSNPGLTEWLIDTDRDQWEPSAPTYIFPHPGRVVVGGTVQLDQWSLDPDPATADAILARATAFAPQLAAARVLAHRVGLRPARTEVRLETVTGSDSATVHCYGHGGSGITLSWGCADDVLQQVEAIADRINVA